MCHHAKLAATVRPTAAAAPFSGVIRSIAVIGNSQGLLVN